MVVSNNVFKFNHSSVGTYKAINLDTILANIESVSVTGNTIVGNLGGGTLGYGVHINARSLAIARAVVANNTIKSAVSAIVFEKLAGSFTNWPVCTGNTITGATTVVSHTSQTILVDGQQGDVVTLVGAGSPETAVTAPVGSVFYRTDGSAATSHYVKESGSAATGWVATGSTSVTVSDDAITFAKMQNIATDRLIGRDTASSGNPEEIAVGGGLEFTGSAGIQRSALTGDVTATAGSGTTAIASNAVVTAKILDANVTNAKLANMAAATLKGSVAGGVPADLSAADATGILVVANATTKGLVPTPPNNTTTFLRGDATFAAPVRKLYLFYGGAAMTAGDSDRYANPVGYSTSPLGTTGVFYTVPVAGNLVATQYQVATAHTTNTVTVAPRVNSVEQTTQKITITATTLYQRTVHGTPLALAQGDVLACQMDHTGATNITFINICFEIEF